jgi:serine/threonine protein kinase/tetratricopeptide (TPR) repeat protein
MEEEAIFGAALEKTVPGERQAFLAEACGGDRHRVALVEALLRAHENPDRFLEAPAAELATIIAEPIREGPGTLIGPFKLLEQIGEGGFGVVFMAEQQRPIRRKVALKILKLGMDTRQVVARFEAERQALALMDHPNIAHVFDGGETTSGRPYFVMELVRGVPITEYCDQNNLAVRTRLELFVSVCQAVQHAHHKGVIHRDLKPSNIMVTMHDTIPVVKVIDFGIAKATGQQLTDKTLFTNFLQMLGTPMYMSPEQSQLNGVDIDTRTDIYALGVLLYELLTSRTPFDKERLRTASYEQIRRIIQEEEPAKPSTLVSTLGKERSMVFSQRKSDPKRLGQMFRHDLDWIVMKALEKDRNRRYETASAFAADVQHFLNDEPVLACPPSLGYRLRKALRRHKGPALAALLVMLVLVGGIIGTTWGLIRATHAEADAVSEAKLKGILALRLAQKQEQTEAALRQAEKNFQLASALIHNKPLKHQLDWLERQGPQRSRQETMKKGLAFFQSLVGEPGSDSGERLLTAEVHIELADIYFFLDQAAQAGPEYEKAIAILRQLSAKFPKETGFRESLAHCLKHKGWLWRSRSNLVQPVEEEKAFNQAVLLYEELRKEFPDVPWYQVQLAGCWSLLGELLRKHDRYQQSAKAHRRALALYEHVFDELPKGSDQRTLVAMSRNHLAWVLVIRPDRLPRHAAEALQHAQKAVALEPVIHDWWHTLGVAHIRMGQWKEGLAAIEKSRELENTTEPPGSFDRFFEAMAYSQLGEHAKARRYYNEGMQWMQKYAPNHPDLRRFRIEAGHMLRIKD